MASYQKPHLTYEAQAKEALSRQRIIPNEANNKNTAIAKTRHLTVTVGTGNIPPGGYLLISGPNVSSMSELCDHHKYPGYLDELKWLLYVCIETLSYAYNYQINTFFSTTSTEYVSITIGEHGMYQDVKGAACVTDRAHVHLFISPRDEKRNQVLQWFDHLTTTENQQSEKNHQNMSLAEAINIGILATNHRLTELALIDIIANKTNETFPTDEYQETLAFIQKTKIQFTGLQPNRYIPHFPKLDISLSNYPECCKQFIDTFKEPYVYMANTHDTTLGYLYASHMNKEFCPPDLKFLIDKTKLNLDAQLGTQLIRRVMAAEWGCPKNWNWRQYPFYDRMRKTMQDMGPTLTAHHSNTNAAKYGFVVESVEFRKTSHPNSLPRSLSDLTC